MVADRIIADRRRAKDAGQPAEQVDGNTIQDAYSRERDAAGNPLSYGYMRRERRLSDSRIESIFNLLEAQGELS